MNGFFEVISRHVVCNDELATPTWIAAGHISFTVAIRVKELRDFRLFQVGEVLDVVLISCFFVDQVALQNSRQDVAYFDHIGVATGFLVERSVQFIPRIHGEVRIPKTDR
ncbi:hypothetical protein D3C81_1783310 [compost metagenome]